MINTTYVLINVNDITDIMIEESITDVNAIRYSNDGTVAILKFGTKFPVSMQGYVKHTHESILSILATPPWCDENI